MKPHHVPDLNLWPLVNCQWETIKALTRQTTRLSEQNTKLSEQNTKLQESLANQLDTSADLIKKLKAATQLRHNIYHMANPPIGGEL